MGITVYWCVGTFIEYYYSDEAASTSPSPNSNDTPQDPANNLLNGGLSKSSPDKSRRHCSHTKSSSTSRLPCPSSSVLRTGTFPCEFKNGWPQRLSPRNCTTPPRVGYTNDFGRKSRHSSIARGRRTRSQTGLSRPVQRWFMTRRRANRSMMVVCWAVRRRRRSYVFRA